MSILPGDPGSAPANLADVVRAAADAAGDRPALIGVGGSRSWAELDAAVDAGCAALSGFGVGERVVLGLPTGPDLAAALFAVLRAGLVAVPVDPARTDLGWVARRVGAVAAAVTDDVASGVAARIDLAQIATWWGSRPDHAAARAGGEHLAMLARASRAHPPVMLSHRALLGAAAALRGAPRLDVRRTDRILQVLPLFHVVGLVTAFLPAALAGAAVVVPEAGASVAPAAAALDAVRANRVSILPAEPTLYRQLDRIAGFERALATVRLMTSGSSPLDPADFAAVRAATGQAVREGYGISESAAAVTSTLMVEAARPGSVGLPYPGVQVRIAADHAVPADEDDLLAGDAQEGGEVGPIAIRGDTLFSGYWPDGHGGPGPDGWFRTGDIGYLDGAGELHLVDRAAETVVVAGFTVYPREVEDVLVTHPYVADAAVVGVPGRAGPVVVAALVPQPGTRPTRDDLDDFLAELLPPFKRPTDYQLVESLPRTEVGRLDRETVRRDLAGHRGTPLDAPADAAATGVDSRTRAAATSVDETPAGSAGAHTPEGDATNGADPGAPEAGPDTQPATDLATHRAAGTAPEAAAGLDRLGVRLPSADSRTRRSAEDTDEDLF